MLVQCWHHQACADQRVLLARARVARAAARATQNRSRAAALTRLEALREAWRSSRARELLPA